MTSQKKTPADIIEEKRLENSNDELDLILSEDNSPGEVYDEIHSLEIRQYLKEKPSISGLELIERLFLKTEQEAEAAKNNKSGSYNEENPAPGPEKISRMKNTVREWVKSWVISGDLLIFEGDINQDFDSCYFPSKKVFRCVGNFDVLVRLRKAGFVVDKMLETHINESLKPEAGTKPQEPAVPTQSEPETPPTGKDDGRGAKLKQDWWALGKLTVSLWKASGRTLKPAEIYDHADYQEALSKGKTGSREYVIKHRIGPAIKGKREVKVKTKNPSKPTNKRKLGLTHVGDQLKKTKRRK